MAKEKVTDIFIADLLKEANITYVPEEGINKEVQEALKTASKKGTGKHGFPEYTAQSNDFILVIEDKSTVDKQALYEDEEKAVLSMEQKHVRDYALNGALHYAQKIVEGTNFKKVFAFGCSGDEKHHQITPIFVDEEKYKILPEIENFENFKEENIAQYYDEQVKGKESEEEKENMILCNQAKILHEYLRNYGQLGETEKPLVVSAILLALNDEENKNLLNKLEGNTGRTDGDEIFDALKNSLENSEIDYKKVEIVLNQFTLIKDRANTKSKR